MKFIHINIVTVLPTGSARYHSGNLAKNTTRVFKGKEKIILVISTRNAPEAEEPCFLL